MYRPPRDPDVPAAGLVYRFAAGVAFSIMHLQRWRFDVVGTEHLPASGGAVIAANHTGFWDYFTVGRPAYYGCGRPVRILAKDSLFRVPGFGWLMHRAEHIEVHRGAGRDAFASAIAALERGELVLVLPEQTISRSFELLPFKTGAVRMAAAAGVPLIPAVSWGTHRFHTAGRRPLPRWRLPVAIRYGEPLHPTPEHDPVGATRQLRLRMQTLLDDAVTGYRDGTPAGQWWVPARYGGGAPTHEQALADLDQMSRGWRSRRVS